MRKQQHKNVLLKGDKEKKCGVSVNHYANSHKWVKRNYGVADRCENPECTGKSKYYHYALKKGCQYEKNRDVFIMLCISCHLKYDWDESKRTSMRVFTDARKKNISERKKGKTFITESGRERMSIRMSGKNNPMYGISVKGEDSAWWGKNHTEEYKLKMALSRAVLTREQVIEIKERHKNGERQNKIADSMGLTKPLICKIVNGKKYKQW